MALKSLWFRYYIFRVTPKYLEKNNPDQRADEVLETGVSLNLNLKITPPSPITGQLCIDFNQLPNQKIFETSDLKECRTKALENSNEYPDDLFCIVQIPESYITGKRGIVEQFAWCVPFVKSNNQTGYCIIPDLILEIYHSYGVVVSNPNYNLAFIPDSNVLTKEQLEAMSKYQWTIGLLKDSQNDPVSAKIYAGHLREHQEWALSRFRDYFSYQRRLPKTQ